MGVAIQYALDNMLTTEAGMRDDRVPKVIFITTDSNPDDDAVSAANEARRRGYTVNNTYFTYVCLLKLRLLGLNPAEFCHLFCRTIVCLGQKTKDKCIYRKRTCKLGPAP